MKNIALGLFCAALAAASVGGLWWLAAHHPTWCAGLIALVIVAGGVFAAVSG